MKYRIEADEFWPSGTQTIGVDGDRIVPASRVPEDNRLFFDADYVVATPGWVNAHAHLELTGSPDIEFNGNFVDWIDEVLAHKQEVTDSKIRENYRTGRMDLLRSGVCHVIDHCDRTDVVLEIVEDLPGGTRLHKELIAYPPDHQETVLEEADGFLSELSERDLPGGLAPHAPYSAHPDLYRRAVERCRQLDCSLSSHLHEVEAELQYARDSTGPFADLQERRAGERLESPYPSGRPLADLVEAGYLNDPCFGVHMNYLNESDYRWLEASRVNPVFCPRSYHYFRHETLPIREWLNRGLAFGLGTDSVASNDGLNMLEELRLLASLIEPDEQETEEILRALTLYPARVMREPDRGVLTAGTPADFSLFDVPSGNPHDLARGQAEPLAVVHDGKLAWCQEPRLADRPC